MAKSSKILQNLGITDSQLRKLYICGLTDTLSSVSGIGGKRLTLLESQLANDCDNERIPDDRNWVYRLTLDVLRIPMKARDICEFGDNGYSLLEQMRLVEQADVRQVNALLSGLSCQEQSIILRHFRDRVTYEQLAREFSCPVGRVRRLKSTAITKLRKPEISRNLQKIIFRDLPATSG